MSRAKHKINPTTGEITDNSVIIAELKVELRRIKESINGDRVHNWCIKAGYRNIYSLDTEGLLALLTAVKKIPTPAKN